MLTHGDTFLSWPLWVAVAPLLERLRAGRRLRLRPRPPRRHRPAGCRVRSTASSPRNRGPLSRAHRGFASVCHRQFCSSTTVWSLCGRQGASEGSAGVVEAWRRKVVVLARLENRGENAYGAMVHISTSSNLLFSSLILKVGNNLE